METKKQEKFNFPINNLSLTSSKHERDYGLYLDSEESKMLFNDLRMQDSYHIVLSIVNDLFKGRSKNILSQKSYIKPLGMYNNSNVPSKASISIIQDPYIQQVCNLVVRAWTYTKPEIIKTFKSYGTVFESSAKYESVEIDGYDEFCFFPKIKITNTLTQEDKEELGIWKDSCHFSIRNSNIYSLDLNSQNFPMELELEGKNIEELTLSSTPKILLDKFEMHKLTEFKFPKTEVLALKSCFRWKTPELENLDFTQVGIIKGFDFSTFERLFPSLNCNFLASSWERREGGMFYDKRKTMEKDIVNYNNKIPFNCKFVFRPDQIWETDLFGYKIIKKLPDDDEKQFVYYTMGELFPVGPDGNVTITMKDIIDYIYKNQKEKILQQITKLNDYLDNPKNFDSILSKKEYEAKKSKIKDTQKSIN